MPSTSQDLPVLKLLLKYGPNLSRLIFLALVHWMGMVWLGGNSFAHFDMEAPGTFDVRLSDIGLAH
jgi:hypothetical protein